MSVSLIIPCYNGRRYLSGLAEWLESVAAEVNEIIFVDDGSTDGSADLIGHLFSDAILVRQPNRGLAAARNSGAKNSSCEYLQFLDCDDNFSPGKITCQIAEAERSGADVVYSDWRMVFVDENGLVTRGELQTGAAPGTILPALIEGWWQPFHSYLFRRAAYMFVDGGDETLVNAQDYDLVIRLAAKGCVFSYCPGPTSDYFRFGEVKSLARGKREQYFADYEKSTLGLLDQLERENRMDRTLGRAFAVKLHYIARNVYPFDKKKFTFLLDLVRQLDPLFSPPGSWKYRIFCWLFGMNRAESLIRIMKGS